METGSWISKTTTFMAVARFLLRGWGGGGAHYRECRRREPCRGVWGILPQKSFKFGGSETLFSALVMRYVSEKSTLNMKMANNCKSLNKITEAKAHIWQCHIWAILVSAAVKGMVFKQFTLG